MKKKLKYIKNDTIKCVPKVEIRIPAQPNMGTVAIYDLELGKAGLIKKPLRSIMNNKTIIHEDVIGVVAKTQPGHYFINPADGIIFPTAITFHTGNPSECVTGVSLESLLAICKDQLEHYNSGEFNCSENTIAIECLSAALAALELRTVRHEKEGKLGTQEP